MKALKEKRISLRSALRRSLVILSLLALVFAGCSSSDDDTSSNGGGGGYQGGGGPRAVSITVAVEPTGPSYQGLPPNLTGMVLDVTWDNGTMSRVEGDLIGQGFYPVPNYCDEAGLGTAISAFTIASANSTASSGPFRVPGVIFCAKLDLTSKGQVIWYSDQKPDYTNFDLEATYRYDSDRPYADARTTGIMPTASMWGNEVITKAKIGISQSYPTVSVNQVTNWFVNASIGNMPGSSGPGVSSERLMITNYYEVAGIEYVPDSAAWDTVFDDDVKYAGDKGEIFALMTASKPSFKIFYFDGTDRIIDWTEFVGNVTYTSTMMGMVVTPTGLTDSIVVSDDGTDTDANGDAILAYDEDEFNWNVILEYVRKEYGAPSSVATYISKFTVPVPVYEFQGEVVISRRDGTGLNNVWIEEKTTNPTEPTKGTADDNIAAINGKWKMVGAYTRLGDTKYKEIEFDVDGLGTMWPNFGTVVNQNLTATYSGNIASGEYAFEPGVPIPVYYRGATYQDEDDTVIVDIYYVEP